MEARQPSETRRDGAPQLVHRDRRPIQKHDPRDVHRQTLAFKREERALGCGHRFVAAHALTVSATGCAAQALKSRASGVIRPSPFLRAVRILDL